MKLRHGSSIVRVVLLVGLIAPSVGSSAVLGLGEIVTRNNDTAVEMIVIDRTNPAVLPAGMYTAASFSAKFELGFEVGANTPMGDTIQPLLVTNPSGDTFNVIALGSTITYTSPTAYTTYPFGGSDEFTLTGSTEVFAGYYWITTSGDRSPIGWNYGEVDDVYYRYGTGVNPPVLGNAINGGTGVGNSGRRYGFEIAVIPEPGALWAPCLLGLALLLRRRR